MNIGFWNIKCEKLADRSDLLVSFVREKQLDILCVAETNDNTNISFLSKINQSGTKRAYVQIKSIKNKISIFSSYSADLFKDKGGLFNSTRWTAHKISIPNILNFNLVSVHLNSKVNWSESSLSLECVNLSRDILSVEHDTNCSETILIGDFNMNPFENGLVAANGLNALPDLKYLTKKPRRTIDGTTYKSFYNPMWNFFGDFKPPYGTHYYRPPGHVSHEWHVYDQVILRPTLAPYLEKNFVDIVTRLDGDNLCKKFERPDSVKYSDHLPIILNLKL